MNLTRLVALSLLENGTQHGHQIRRYAELTAAGRWGGVNVRSLPRELRQLEEDGLVALVRTEQIVHRPERRIYEITDSGRQELHILREQAMGELHTSPDPLAVALVSPRLRTRASSFFGCNDAVKPWRWSWPRWEPSGYASKATAIFDHCRPR
ncbi:MAG TPA: PadR family transcriptional regulator [Propionibacteriaceae bacterium]|nr:PadR family transcriptional regulator [Propionibacteriaceae bacterium]